jgi:hypothetical protein
MGGWQPLGVMGMRAPWRAVAGPGYQLGIFAMAGYTFGFLTTRSQDEPGMSVGQKLAAVPLAVGAGLAWPVVVAASIAFQVRGYWK